MTLISYDEKNLEIVSKLIMDNLTPDLLPKKWVERNGTNPTFGHCHNAAGCLYKIFGHKNLKMYRAKDDEGIWHWWCLDLNGKRIDLTADQYYSTGRKPPYEDGQKASLLGWGYRKRVEKLTNVVQKGLDITSEKLK